MSTDDDKIKTRKGIHPNQQQGLNPDEEGESGQGTSTGGQGGSGIEFYDFLAPAAPSREDLLPRDQLNHLLITHKDIQLEKVKKQLEKRNIYKDLKNHKLSLAAFRAGTGALNGSQYHNHPLLSTKAQFNGANDKQVSPLPTENPEQANPELRERLQNKLQYRLGHELRPKFNPKPQGPY